MDDLESRLEKVLAGGASPMQDELLGSLLKASPLLFAQLFLPGPPQAPFFGRLLFSDSQMEWERIFTQQQRFCIVASRGSGKTRICTVINALWRCATEPEGSAYIFSGTEFAAQRILDEIKTELEKNPKLQWLFPGTQARKWTATQIRTSNGHHLVAKGMLTRVRGAHPNRVWLDDAETDEDAWSAAKRQKTIDFFYSTITNMTMPGGQIGVVGTPFHTLDLLGSLKANPAYKTYVYPALDAQRQSTWPEVYTTEHLLALEKEIGTVRFARERQCQPVSDESSLFPMSLFFEGDILQPQARLGSPLEYWRSMGIVDTYIGVDFAFSVSTGSDFFVITVLGVDAHQNRWLLDVFRDRGVSFSAQKAHIVSMARRYDPKLVLLESNAAQQVAADELRRETDLPIRKYYMTSQKHSLEDGLPSLRILLENNKLRLPRGDARSVEVTDLFIDEANNFTWINGQAKSVGGHDDMTFSWYLCEQAVRKGQRSGKFLIDGQADAPQSPLPRTFVPKPSAAPGITAPQPIVRKEPPPPPTRPSGLMPQGTTFAPQSTPGGTEVVFRNGQYVRVDCG